MSISLRNRLLCSALTLLAGLANVHDAAAQPQVTSQSKHTHVPNLGLAAGDRFGAATAIEGDVMVVGAPNSGSAMDTPGGAFVFLRSAGIWAQLAQLDAPTDPPTDGDAFGTAVAISGDTIAVGAPADDVGGSASGSVWVFRNVGGVWTFEQKINAADRLSNDAFGTSVSLSGNSLIVGAPGDDDGATTDSGSAYVFTRTGNTWSQQQKLTASDFEPEGAFGSAVSISGDRALIGAPGTGADSGAAYAFVRSGTTWSQQQRLSTQAGRFGASVAIQDVVAVVGSPTAAGGGVARVFRLAAGAWAVEDDLLASDRAGNDGFGSSVGLDGDRVVVSAPGDDHDAGAGGTNNAEGSAYLFVRDGSNDWVERAKLTAADAGDNDQGGGNAGDDKSRLVSISGSSISMGAYLDNAQGPSSGSVYVFNIFGSSPVIINEVDADTPSNPDTAEIIELFDGGVGNTPLDGLVVVLFNGLNDSSYTAFDLDGQTTDGSGYFVLGGSSVAGAQIVLADNSLQDGADAVALYAWNGADFPNGQGVTTTNLVDALVYDSGQADDPDLLALLNAGQPQVSEAGGDPELFSSQRCLNGTGGARNTSSYIAAAPTPGAATADTDGDGLCDAIDNCPMNANADQADADGDLIGDVCDACPQDPDNDMADGDGVCGNVDNCPVSANADQSDLDGDLIGDVCDSCPNDAENDVDQDGICGDVDACPIDPDNDGDGDSFCADVDNCPLNANADQADGDADGVGDVCDACPNDAGNDADGDGLCADVDPCPLDATNDVDGDGLCADADNCPADANADQANADGDSLGDVCDACPMDANNDVDGDGVCGDVDNCPADANADQANADGDSAGDVCDACDSDANKVQAGVCGCGVADTDSDGDNTPDCNDGCAGDPGKVAPGICGCGIADTDSDGDGTADCNDGCAADPAKTAPGTCGCGIADTDSDGDGTPDCNDGCAGDSGKTAPGTCGCGIADTDSDGDGTADCNDGCASDSAKSAPGVCGCGAADVDADGDAVCDSSDNCPASANADQADADGDGIGDACETVEQPPTQDICGVGACGAGVASMLPLMAASLGLFRTRRRRA